MKITVLTENITENPIICAEHGLSLYIETDAHKILFDMGQTDLFYKNATILGVDLAEVDIAILSHGHYDHGGGLSTFLKINNSAPVYISPYAFEPHYNGKEKYIGLDSSLQGSSRLIFTANTEIIDTSLSIHSYNDREMPNFLGSFGLTKRLGDEFIPDDFIHEQYLLIRENGKRVLISGCSHKGIIDIVDWSCPDVLIGGFHLSKISDTAELDKIANALSSHKASYYTCHCTGTAQYEYLKSKMPYLEYLSCGKVIEL
ncbi:MAG: MBL fold metallo-hydrolase [Clostridia bacterium]|nr:MBL fold metallo-hydrolase [Clostridia bacterium]